MKVYDRLTWGIYNTFGGRKKAGYLSVIVDLSSDIIYPVPLDMEHIDFVSKLLGISKSEIAFDERVKKFIPSIIEIEDTGIEVKVSGILTGVSGLEIGCGVRHSKEDLEKAHLKVIDFVNRGELPVAEDFISRSKIQYRYSF
ncbi:MAG: hypothetical protein QXG86_00455 [Candidatus Woesearchaeota archaeon]